MPLLVLKRPSVAGFEALNDTTVHTVHSVYRNAAKPCSQERYTLMH